MLTENIEIADAYWASEFGCARACLRPQVPYVQQHSGRLSDYCGAFVLVLDSAPLISVPNVLLSSIGPRATEFVAQAVQSPEVLRRLLLPGNVTKIVGPAFLNYELDVSRTR